MSLKKVSNKKGKHPKSIQSQPKCTKESPEILPTRHLLRTATHFFFAQTVSPQTRKESLLAATTT